VEAGTDAKVPFAQCVHADAAAFDENEPGLQGVHVELLMAPNHGEKYPAEHDTQLLLAFGPEAYVPVGHSSQKRDADTEEKEPAPHSEQDKLLVAPEMLEKNPGRQSMQLELPVCLSANFPAEHA
jgi:hypothetical protein